MLKKLKKLLKKAVAKKPVRKAVKRTVKKAVKKASSKKTAKKVPAKKAAKAVKAEKPIGKVTHFYGGIKVAIVKFSKDMKKGALVRFEGATTNFVQALESMQYNHAAVLKAPKGKQIGIKVKKRVRDGDKVYSAK